MPYINENIKSHFHISIFSTACTVQCVWVIIICSHHLIHWYFWSTTWSVSYKYDMSFHHYVKHSLIQAPKYSTYFRNVFMQALMCVCVCRTWTMKSRKPRQHQKKRKKRKLSRISSYETRHTHTQHYMLCVAIIHSCIPSVTFVFIWLTISTIFFNNFISS